MSRALTLLILTFATFRVTRFFLFDTIVQGLRHRWYNFWLGGTKLQFVRNKVIELTSCSWCFGVHVAYTLYGLWFQTWPWDFGVKGCITVAAIAGVAGMVHSWEPNDDE